MIFDAAWTLGLIPLLWLILLQLFDHDRGPFWWWLAAGFAVSWLADAFARPHANPFVSQLYPVTQASIFAMVLGTRRQTEWMVAIFLATASTSIVVRHAQGLDVAVYVVAGIALSWLAWRRWQLGGWLRWSLGIAFGLGAVAWCAYVADPGWWTWGGYQTTRLVGTLAWCVAAWQDQNSRPTFLQQEKYNA